MGPGGRARGAARAGVWLRVVGRELRVRGGRIVTVVIRVGCWDRRISRSWLSGWALFGIRDAFCERRWAVRAPAEAGSTSREDVHLIRTTLAVEGNIRESSPVV